VEGRELEMEVGKVRTSMLSQVLATAQGSERRRFAGPTRTDGGETKQERVAAAGRKE
jgi:hypothetical protein